MSYSRSAWSALLSLTVLLVASCGTEPGMHTTITVEQAEQRVEEYFRHALAVLPAQARPEISLIHTVECDDPTDNGPKGRKIASVNYQIHNLPRDEYPEYVADLEHWWLDHNFRVLDDERPTYESIWVENNDDGFRMRIQANDVGGLYLIATSPCVWQNGTPEPE
ncbi:MAG: hypothetical protein GEV28_37035 [Actinophytocola sp.]|uniref:hypothetical protein n=1 Tax=Actinophytocola sp. TaxID=1872138 RepID=UPI0013297132|nr:hypothetical protein [Actinophytocola sp.]MPZ85687.1 hypothetical protein [Actinophytocola sp.]